MEGVQTGRWGTPALQTRTTLSVPDLLPGNGDRMIIVLTVDDLDTVEFPHSEPVVLDGRIRAAYLRDPEENLIELQQWLATRAG